jgi:hypothetical protein
MPAGHSVRRPQGEEAMSASHKAGAARWHLESNVGTVGERSMVSIVR